MENKYNKFKTKLECIFCKYEQDSAQCRKSIMEDNWHCPTLQNIYYGKLIKYQPFKIIHNIKTKFNSYKTDKYYDTFNEDCTENNNYKFIFGVISYDDLSSNKPNLLTMNDLDIIYDKKNKTYSWSIEYIYDFKNYDGRKQYLANLLKVFTRFMIENGYDINGDYSYGLFTNITQFDTLEECYANFKYCVNGYINS